MKNIAPLLITYGVQKHLWSNYDPDSKNPPGSFLLAGRGKNGFWYSNTAIAGNLLFKMLMYPEKYKPIIDFFQQNKDKLRLIPWFHYKEKKLNKNLETFVRDNIKDTFEDMIIMKPVEDPNKNHFEIKYFAQEENVFQESSIAIVTAKNVEPEANQNILALMDYWTKILKMNKTSV